MRKVTPSDLVGKTIQFIDNKSVNFVELFFTDGTSLKLYTEIAITTPDGSIPGFFVEDSISSN